MAEIFGNVVESDDRTARPPLCEQILFLLGEVYFSRQQQQHRYLSGMHSCTG
jgi:hypothetical protein